ncbi:O-linked N-acetylglucosamine transferase, SPINDLY family protein [Anaeromyxobacter paludicola]|uniref:protein O-GlcNAc transferase n=1 Tax=Anaeromyxobacter paludicola TaxID=2918171 RepID=A0ABN6N4C1_9BACT|nr:tetratricopeptide repeat protein [Anaeromyxobacter paludicola]BDG08019.1 hypothetical protein AMPC_11320 [Anaeromyxobacter paludicola]
MDAPSLGTALALYRAGRLAESQALCEELVARDPGCGGAWERLAVIADRTGRPAEAVALYERALPHVPHPAAIHANLGALWLQLGERGRALEHLLRAAQGGLQDPALAVNLGALLRELGRLGDAEALLRLAVEAAPESGPAHAHLGLTLVLSARVAEGLGALRRAVALAPEDAATRSSLLLALHYSDEVGFGELAAAHRAAGGPPRARELPPPPDRPLRLGLLSADLRQHPVPSFVEPLLEAARARGWDLCCYASVARPDEVTARLRELAPRWCDVAGLSDEAAAARVRADGVDVLLELGGHTAGSRLGVLAHRAAPLQGTWIGYPDVTGCPEVDLRITDPRCDPPSAPWPEVPERPLRLAGGFLAWRPPADAPPVVPPPAGPFTFGSFNSLAKVSPATLALWRAALAAVPGSELLVKSPALSDDATREGFRRLASAAGLPPERLRLAGHAPGARAHLAAYGQVHVALDTFPYNGTTTTCEALWMGVPVLSLGGETHASRVGASLLAAVGLGELAVRRPEDHVRAAAALAASPERLAGLRGSLRARLRASPLLDGGRLLDELERGLRAFWAERARDPRARVA